MANYGDVALNLAPEWSRSKERNRKYALGMVGHTDGVADAYLTKEPDTRHQFAWVEPKYRDEVDDNRTRGYKFVKNTDNEWTKNEFLWEWNAEGFCVYQGQYLMARPAELFYQEEKEKNRFLDNRASSADAEAARIAAKAGFTVTGEDERPVRTRRRA